MLSAGVVEAQGGPLGAATTGAGAAAFLGLPPARGFLDVTDRPGPDLVDSRDD